MGLRRGHVREGGEGGGGEEAGASPQEKVAVSLDFPSASCVCADPFLPLFWLSASAHVLAFVR